MNKDKLKKVVIEEVTNRLTAKNSKLLKALMLIDALDPEQRVHGMSDYALRGLILHMGSIARAAVADFEGDKQ